MKSKTFLFLFYIFLALLFTSCTIPYNYFIVGKLNPPKGLEAKLLSDNTVFLTWEEMAPDTTYYLYRSIDNTEPSYYARIYTTFFNDTNVNPNVKYTYCLSAHLQYYDESDKSPLVSITTPAAVSGAALTLEAPQLLLAKNGSLARSIELSWSLVTDAVEYEIFFSYNYDSQKYRLYTPSPVTNTSYIINNLSENLRYYFYVRAIDAKGNPGEFSDDYVSVTTPYTYYTTADKAFVLEKNKAEYFYTSIAESCDCVFIKVKTDNSGKAELLINDYRVDSLSYTVYSSNKTTIITPDSSEENDNTKITISGRESEEDIYIEFSPKYSSALFFIYQK